MQQKKQTSKISKSHYSKKKTTKSTQQTQKQNINLQEPWKKHQQNNQAAQKGQKPTKQFQNNQSFTASYKMMKILKMLGLVLSFVQLFNIIALNFMEYKSQKIILQLFIAFIILPILSIFLHLVFVCLHLSAAKKKSQIQAQIENNNHQTINSQIKTKPILVEKESKKNQKKTAKIISFNDEIIPSKDVLTIKKMHNAKNQAFRQKTSHHNLWRALSAISNVINILINIIFGTLCLIAYNDNTSFGALIQAQIVLVYVASIINLYLTYCCYIAQEKDNKVIDKQEPRLEYQSSLRPVVRKTSLEQQITMNFNINQQKINGKLSNFENKAIVMCQSVQQSPSNGKIFLKQQFEAPYSQIQHQYSPSSQIIKEEIKKSVLKLSRNDLSNKQKSIGDGINGQKKKVQINFKKNQIFEYSDINPSNQNSAAEAQNWKSKHEENKKRSKSANKYKARMQMQRNLLNKKRIQRELIQHQIKSSPKLKSSSITNAFDQFEKENQHI